MEVILNYLVKLFILIIPILFIICIRYKKYDFEKKLIRYIKINQRQLKINNYEEKLFSIIKYVDFLKNSKHIISFEKVKSPKVSFITTIFNQENYLSNFIFSVQNQKLKDFEFIFIDDCSTDNGITIIRKIEKKEKRKKNKID